MCYNLITKESSSKCCRCVWNTTLESSATHLLTKVSWLTSIWCEVVWWIDPHRCRTRHFAGTRKMSRHNGQGQEKLLQKHWLRFVRSLPARVWAWRNFPWLGQPPIWSSRSYRWEMCLSFVRTRCTSDPSQCLCNERLMQPRTSWSLRWEKRSTFMRVMRSAYVLILLLNNKGVSVWLLYANASCRKSSSCHKTLLVREDVFSFSRSNSKIWNFFWNFQMLQETSRPVVIFQCAKCNKIVGDSTALVEANQDMQTLTISGKTLSKKIFAGWRNAVFFTAGQNLVLMLKQIFKLRAHRSSEMIGGTYRELKCEGCDSLLGRSYFSRLRIKITSETRTRWWTYCELQGRIM